jgi:phosphoserine phosphatase RsbX
MQSGTLIPQQLIAWGVASRALPGQPVCGDLHLVKPVADGILMAVVDGLGHGDEAVVASKRAIATLEAHSDGSLTTLVRQCHEALTKTRGVVMTVAALQPSASRLTWLGVGNVEAVVLSGGGQAKGRVDHILLRAGIVGYRLPELRASNVTVSPGDLLVFATDGVGGGLTKGLRSGDSPQRIADNILERHFKGHDDALVLVVRFLGSGHEQPRA